MNDDKLKELLDQYLTGTISVEGKTELLQLIDDPEQGRTLDLLLQETFTSEVFAGEDDPVLRNEIQNWLKQKIGESEGAKVVELSPVEKKTPVRKPVWVRYAAAVVIVMVAGYVLWVTSRKSEAGSQKSEVAKTNDVPAPKETRAVITLADGRKVYLDSVGNGVLAQQSDVSVIKNANGQIVYSNEGAKSQSELVYNTLTNPRGSKVINVTLSDGSHVWLNAGSSVTYPVAFAGNERKVEITGEAYFEVAHDAMKPFKVNKGTTEVTVLGTHFNVNAYDDEDALHITLLEGSVAVKNERNNVKIKPGEQAVVTSSIEVKKGVDVDEVMAWKNGLFQFNNADIETVMRQIARWYDVDVAYESRPIKIFRGGLPRDLSAMKVFKVLEETGGVRFRIEGRKVIVMQ